MKTEVFISWSGSKSGEIAEILHDWLKQALHFVNPYFSKNLTKGARWTSDVIDHLEKAHIGLIITTPENLSSKWITFEAGALSKQIANARVCPILFLVESQDIEGPLSQFQMAKFSKKDFFKVFKMVNDEAGDTGLEEPFLTKVFDQWWPSLEEQVAKVGPIVPGEKSVQRSAGDINLEILERVRTIEITHNDYDEHIRREFELIDQLIAVCEKMTLKISSLGISQMESMTLQVLNPLAGFMSNINSSTNRPDQIKLLELNRKFEFLEKLILEMNDINE